MKNIKIYFASILLILITGRCKEMNPFEGVSLVVTDEPANSPVLLRFIDANPESKTQPDKITIKITSDKASYILNDVGGKNYKVAGNMLALKLDKGLVASWSAPVKFTVQAEAPGYIGTSQTFTLISSDPARLVMPMVNIKEPPKGVITVEASVPVSGGKISILNRGGGTGTGVASLTRADAEAGSVAFQTGTQVMDANGNVITATQVNAEIAVFNPQEAQSYGPALFKSGESRDRIRFIQAGFISIKMWAGGKEVKRFSKPIEVSMVVSPDLRNPLTGEVIKEGSTIPTWSLDETTYKWKEEGVAVVSKNSQGDLVVKFEVSHLSYWQCSYYTPPAETCELRVALKVKSNSMFNSGRYYADLYDSKGFLYRTPNFYITDGVYNYIDSPTPKGEKIKLVVTDAKSGKSVGEATFDACSNIDFTKPHEINITIPNPIKPLFVDFDLSAICKNKNLKLKPNLTASMELSEEGYLVDWNFIDLYDGKAEGVPVIEGKDYAIRFVFDGKLYSGKFNFKRNGLVQMTTSEEGADFSGLNASATYDAVKDLITYKAQYVITNCK